jgi:transposase InsO family protein
MKQSNEPDWERALAKYAVIAPLVCRELDAAEREAVRKEILGALHLFPGGKQRHVAKRTLRKWVQQYRQANLEGLRSGERKDKGVPRAIPQEVLERAKALKAELPERSARAICDLLASEGTAPVAKSTLAYHLRNSTTLLAKTPKAFRRFEHTRPNDCWQSDLSDGLWLSDPADPSRQCKYYLHAFLDDHSRLVPHAQFYWRESLPALEDCFRQAITKHGVPRMAYWDNGSAFRAQQLRKMAARLRVEIGLRHAVCPRGQGKDRALLRRAQGHLLP